MYMYHGNSIPFLLGPPQSLCLYTITPATTKTTAMTSNNARTIAAESPGLNPLLELPGVEASVKPLSVVVSFSLARSSAVSGGVVDPSLPSVGFMLMGGVVVALPEVVALSVVAGSSGVVASALEVVIPSVIVCASVVGA